MWLSFVIGMSVRDKKLLFAGCCGSLIAVPFLYFGSYHSGRIDGSDLTLPIFGWLIAIALSLATDRKFTA